MNNADGRLKDLIVNFDLELIVSIANTSSHTESDSIT